MTDASCEISDPVAAAEAAGLRYVRDDRPGIRRVRCGRAFRYVRPDGHPVRDDETLGRIRSLAVPPAWTEVWICPRADGHLQAMENIFRNLQSDTFRRFLRQSDSKQKIIELIEEADQAGATR